MSLLTLPESAASATSSEARPAPPAAVPLPDRIAEVERIMVSLADPAAGDPAGRIASDHLGTGGKRLRAWLALAAADALSAPAAAATWWAASCELLHNATLVHDDIQDGDRVRRGAPTAWVTHGTAQAITAGDLLLMLPFLAVGRIAVSGEVRSALATGLARHAAATARGQAADLATGPDDIPDWPAYRAIAEGKTSALFQLPVHGAALLGGIPEPAACGLAAPFRRLGVLFQLQDDVLDLYGDKGRLRRGNDLRQGRPGILVSEHLRRVPGDAGRMVELLATGAGEAEVDAAATTFRHSGALAAALARVRREHRALLNDSGLRFRPGLHALASALAERALEPIAPLMEEAGR
jgi:geranylgeranyl diphosphate synthase, type I